MESNKIHINDLLQEALQRKHEQEPHLPADFADRISQRMAEQRRVKPSKKMAGMWLKYTSVAAAVVVAFLLGAAYSSTSMSHEENATPMLAKAIETEQPAMQRERVVIQKTDTVFLPQYIPVEKWRTQYETIRIVIPDNIAVNDSVTQPPRGRNNAMEEMQQMMNEFIKQRTDNYASI